MVARKKSRKQFPKDLSKHLNTKAFLELLWGKDEDRLFEAAGNICKDACWSLHETVDHMDEVAAKGQFTLEYNEHWGPKPVSIKLPKNPTWADLAKAGEKLVKKSKDNHHVFIETFTQISRKTIVMDTGS